jgi:hypothetical protein
LVKPSSTCSRRRSGVELAGQEQLQAVIEEDARHRHELQEVAGLAGKSETRSIRAKTPRRS